MCGLVGAGPAHVPEGAARCRGGERGTLFRTFFLRSALHLCCAYFARVSRTPSARFCVAMRMSSGETGMRPVRDDVEIFVSNGRHSDTQTGGSTLKSVF